MSLSTGPLRVTAEQWRDIREHYEDPGDYDEPECEACGTRLTQDDEYESGRCWKCQQPEE